MDGRERPWRAPSSSLTISSPPGVAGRAAERAALQSYVVRLQEQLDELPGDPWHDLPLVNRSRLWLTKAETRQFQQELLDVVKKHQRGRTNADHPPNTRPVTSFIASLPSGAAPDG